MSPASRPARTQETRIALGGTLLAVILAVQLLALLHG